MSDEDTKPAPLAKPAPKAAAPASCTTLDPDTATQVACACGLLRDYRLPHGVVAAIVSTA